MQVVLLILTQQMVMEIVVQLQFFQQYHQLVVVEQVEEIKTTQVQLEQVKQVVQVVVDQDQVVVQ